MGIIDTLLKSVIQVGAALFGFGFLIWGAQQASMGGNEVVGVISALIGIVLLVFAARY